jgi:diguanylate cyclase (GGDEF)-like protein
MTRRSKGLQSTGCTVLLVDDNADYLQATRLLLEREGHTVLTATNGPEALGLLPEHKIDLLLLDYFMPGMTGEQVVTEVRKVDRFVQVILQTGYASEQPPRELLERLDIQGYYDKTEGPEQLLLWTAVGLKAAATIQHLFKGRRGVEFVLERTADLHRLQPTRDLCSDMLKQAARLLAEVDVATGVTGFVATLDADGQLVVRAGLGAFTGEGKARDVIDAERLGAAHAALEEARLLIGPLGTMVPLRVGPHTLGVVHLDHPIVGDHTLALIQLLANQAAAALQSSQLYEVSAVDLLTEAHTRPFFDYALARELAASVREQHAVAVVVVDIDDLQRINAEAGHVAGDQALRSLGRVLRQVTRAGDVVGRLGSDSFGVVLRNPLVVGPARLASRVRELLKSQSLAGPRGEVPIQVSIGFSFVGPYKGDRDDAQRPAPSYFPTMAERLLASAVAALGDARAAGGNTVRGAEPITWP